MIPKPVLSSSHSEVVGGFDKMWGMGDSTLMTLLMGIREGRQQGNQSSTVTKNEREPEKRSGVQLMRCFVYNMKFTVVIKITCSSSRLG